MENLEEKISQENLRDVLIAEGLRKTQVETILLLNKVSKGAVYFQTTLEELAETFYEDYQDLKMSNVKASKNYKTRIRCRLDYFVNEWQNKHSKTFFEIVSKECSDGCASIHTAKNPNPDVIKIRLNLPSVKLNYSDN